MPQIDNATGQFLIELLSKRQLGTASVRAALRGRRVTLSTEEVSALLSSGPFAQGADGKWAHRLSISGTARGSTQSAASPIGESVGAAHFTRTTLSSSLNTTWMVIEAALFQLQQSAPHETDWEALRRAFHRGNPVAVPKEIHGRILEVIERNYGRAKNDTSGEPKLAAPTAPTEAGAEQATEPLRDDVTMSDAVALHEQLRRKEQELKEAQERERTLKKKLERKSATLQSALTNLEKGARKPTKPEKIAGSGPTKADLQKQLDVREQEVLRLREANRANERALEKLERQASTTPRKSAEPRRTGSTTSSTWVRPTKEQRETLPTNKWTRFETTTDAVWYGYAAEEPRTYGEGLLRTISWPSGTLALFGPIISQGRRNREVDAILINPRGITVVEQKDLKARGKLSFPLNGAPKLDGVLQTSLDGAVAQARRPAQMLASLVKMDGQQPGWIDSILSIHTDATLIESQRGDVHLIASSDLRALIDSLWDPRPNTVSVEAVASVLDQLEVSPAGLSPLAGLGYEWADD